MTQRQRGMTLIEVVIAIVVLGICVASGLSLLSWVSMRSASAMTRSQATAVASAYLENILSQPYGNIAGYNNIDHPGARDANGNAIAELQNYRVRVDVNTNSTLGVAPNDVPATRVDVTVTDPTGARTQITGYRTSFVGQVIY